jgi:putative membrane protein
VVYNETMYSRNSNRRWIFLVPIILAVAFFATFLGLSLYYHGASPPYYGPPFFFGWGFFPWFFFFPVIFLAFFAFRWIFWGGWGWGWGGYYRGYYDDPAMETLKQRYARGEITKEQFEQMTKDLEQHA